MNHEGTQTQQTQGMMTGQFNDKASLESAYESLRAQGMTEDQINNAAGEPATERRE